MAQDSRIQQISLSLSARTGTIVPAATANVEQRRKDLQLLRQALDLELESWPLKLNTRFPPSPLYIPLTHINELERLQVALSKALTNIVGRWYIDQEANFPSRMPLEDHEERVLKVCEPYRRALHPDKCSGLPVLGGLWYLISNPIRDAGDQTTSLRRQSRQTDTRAREYVYVKSMRGSLTMASSYPLTVIEAMLRLEQGKLAYSRPAMLRCDLLI